MMFRRSLLDRLLEEEYGSQIFNYRIAYNSLIFFLISIVLCIKGYAFFTPSFLVSFFVLLICQWSYYVFEFKLVKKFRFLFICICVLFVAVLPMISYHLTNSFEYLSSTSAFVQCVFTRHKDIVLISPVRSDDEDLSNHIYMIRKQDSVKKMVEIFEKETGQRVTYEYQDGKGVNQFKITTDDKNYVVSIYKYIDYDILMVYETLF